MMNMYNAQGKEDNRIVEAKGATYSPGKLRRGLLGKLTNSET